MTIYDFYEQHFLLQMIFYSKKKKITISLEILIT